MPARMVPSGSQSIPNEKHFRRRLTGDGALAHFAFSHNVGKRPAKVDFCRDRGIEEKFRLLRSRLLEKVSNASTRLSTGVEASTPSAQRMLTARAASSAMIRSDSSDCSIIKTFAHLASTGTSVGEKAVLVLKARNK
jgi:hypothetical protein